MILDAKDLIVGRFATVVAKKALLGEKVDIVNCEKAVFTGNRRRVIDDIKRKRVRGIPLKGPYYPRQADRVVRRAIRGMLPYKKAKGSEAYKRVMCYLGIPHKFKDGKFETIENANVKKLPTLKYISVGELCKEMGAKV